MNACRSGRCSVLLTLVTATAVLWAAPADAADSAQKVVRVGFVDPESRSTGMRGTAAFWQRLRELGWVEGENFTVERRWADGQLDRLPALMAEVVGRNVDVIVTSSTPAVMAAKKASNTIPIVVPAMGDPVGLGFAESLAHPGGNVTGLSLEMTQDLIGKWMELLQEIVPRVSKVAVIANTGSAFVRKQVKEVEAIAPRRGVKLRVIEVRDAESLDEAFKEARRQAQAALVLPDPMTLHHRNEVTALAARYRLPVMYGFLEFVDAGGLAAYGVDNTVLFRRAADYVDKILRGASPGDLPIEQPTQWSLAINLKTAKTLGLKIRESILVRADEVIR
jgi:putative tryptophan/tyrosine transport system substrate-binding protein